MPAGMSEKERDVAAATAGQTSPRDLLRSWVMDPEVGSHASLSVAGCMSVLDLGLSRSVSRERFAPYGWMEAREDKTWLTTARSGFEHV
jgi:hypothetical protein